MLSKLTEVLQKIEVLEVDLRQILEACREYEVKVSLDIYAIKERLDKLETHNPNNQFNSIIKPF